jgi:hypothetical protein
MKQQCVKEALDARTRSPSDPGAVINSTTNSRTAGIGVATASSP